MAFCQCATLNEMPALILKNTYALVPPETCQREIPQSLPVPLLRVGLQSDVMAEDHLSTASMTSG